jgi:flagellar biosynthetic protein FliR
MFGFELTNWLMVFLRAIGLLSVFPLFSSQIFPVQARIGLGALLAILVTPLLPAVPISPSSVWGLVGYMAMELGVGLLLGFASRMVFYALDLAGGIISTQIGLLAAPTFNPMTATQTTETGTILYYLAAVLWLVMDMHHYLLIGFQQSYLFLPVGGAHLHDALFHDIIGRTGFIFVLAVLLAAPLIAVGFIINLTFAVLSRAVPQMNVFIESFAVRILAGLTVFGLTAQLMAQHIVNYLRRLPEDFLRVAQLLGVG